MKLWKVQFTTTTKHTRNNEKVEKHIDYVEFGLLDFCIPGYFPLSSLKFYLLKRYKNKTLYVSIVNGSKCGQKKNRS